MNFFGHGDYLRGTHWKRWAGQLPGSGLRTFREGRPGPGGIIGLRKSKIGLKELDPVKWALVRSALESFMGFNGLVGQWRTSEAQYSYRLSWISDGSTIIHNSLSRSELSNPDLGFFPFKVWIQIRGMLVQYPGVICIK